MKCFHQLGQATWTVWPFLAAAVALGGGCSETPGGEMTCVPGESDGCVCEDGSYGAQVCADDGLAFGACRCADGGDGDADGDADGDGDADPNVCDASGTYLVSGTVVVCEGCEWQGFSDEPFTFSHDGEVGFAEYDGFTHGPLEFGTTDLCMLHGTDSWEADEYVQGNRSWSGVGTYHFNFVGDEVE